MSSSTDRRTGSRADRGASASLSRLRWPSKQDRKQKDETSAGSATPPDEAHEREAREDPYVAEGMRQLALAVVIVLGLGFFFIRLFGPNDASVGGAASNEASRASPVSLANAPNSLLAAPSTAARLEVEFDRPAPAGQPLPLRLNVADAPEDSTIVISGFGPGMTLSAGENRDVEWRLARADWSNLSVIPPKNFVGNTALVVELRLPNGSVARREIIKLEWTGEAAAGRTPEAAQANPPPPPAASETPAAVTTAAPDAAPVAESPQEKQVARALPPQDEAPAQAVAPAKQAAASRAEPEEESGTGRVAPCFAKLDGKVVLQGSCRVATVEGKSVTFVSGEKRLSLTLDHGRIWRLKWNDEDKGKIYKREECWGSEKAFVCEYPPRAKPKS